MCGNKRVIEHLLNRITVVVRIYAGYTPVNTDPSLFFLKMPKNTFKFHQFIINHVMTDYDSLKDLPKCSRKNKGGGWNVMQERHWISQLVRSEMGRSDWGPTKNVPTFTFSSSDVKF